jgi:hypothetical protein
MSWKSAATIVSLELPEKVRIWIAASTGKPARAEGVGGWTCYERAAAYQLLPLDGRIVGCVLTVRYSLRYSRPVQFLPSILLVQPPCLLATVILREVAFWERGSSGIGDLEKNMSGRIHQYTLQPIP